MTDFFLFVVQPILYANNILIINNSFLCNCKRLQFAQHMAVQVSDTRAASTNSAGEFLFPLFVFVLIWRIIFWSN